MAPGSSVSRRSRAIFVALLLLVLVGFGLRLVYASRISLYIDEFTSIWAGKLILQRGVPLTPAGVIYHRGILFSYVEALAGLLFGFSEMASRMPSVFISCVAVVCLYLVGKRMLSDSSGLLAAAFVTFVPLAIVWGARARMYSLLQLLSLIAVYSLFEAVMGRQGRRYEYLFLLSFFGAVFSQEQAVLLYPALVVAVLALGQWRWLVQRRTLMVNAFCWLTILARYVLDQVGRPTQWELVQTGGISSAQAESLIGGLRAYLSFFLHPDQILLTALCVVAFAHALLAISRGRKNLDQAQKRWLRSLAFLSGVLVVIVAEMLVAGGARWSEARYFFMVLPLLVLIASNGLDRTVLSVRGLAERAGSGRLSGPVSGPVLYSLVVLVGFAYLPGIDAVLSRQIEGHDRAMRYLADQWREGDVILTASPPVCAVYLDHCDYYAMQKGYEGFVIDREGESVDVWTGTPFLNTVAGLREVLRGNERVWFVVDGWRLATRYELGFLEVVASQLEVVHEVQGVKILLSQGYTDVPAPVVQGSLAANLEDRVALVSYDLDAVSVDPGEKVCVTLHWRATAPLDEEYTVFVHLLSRNGSIVGQDDSPPVSGLYPTIYWQEGQIVPDRHCLEVHQGLHEDRYLLETGMYEPDTRKRLEVVGTSGTPIANQVAVDYVLVGGVQGAAPQPQHHMGADLGAELRLLGCDVGRGLAAGDERLFEVEPGGVIPVTIYWQALAPMERNYTVFLHLVDRQGRIWGQADGQPDRGFYPTSFWDVGEVVVDTHEIPVYASTPEGDYELLGGVYEGDSGERLLVLDEADQPEGDSVLLGSVRVERS
jgi:4-amino-4-deoxy-L-arabinose transferase-like glycosyltransferase